MVSTQCKRYVPAVVDLAFATGGAAWERLCRCPRLVFISSAHVCSMVSQQGLLHAVRSHFLLLDTQYMLYCCALTEWFHDADGLDLQCVINCTAARFSSVFQSRIRCFSQKNVPESSLFCARNGSLSGCSCENQFPYAFFFP